jgi:hypothetical protein
MQIGRSRKHRFGAATIESALGEADGRYLESGDLSCAGT